MSNLKPITFHKFHEYLRDFGKNITIENSLRPGASGANPRPSEKIKSFNKKSDYFHELLKEFTVK